MTIAIISDIHDSLANMRKALSWISKQDIGTLVVLGDMTTADLLETMCKSFPGPIHFVFGNADNDRDGMRALQSRYDHLKIHGNHGKIEVDDRKIAFAHHPSQARELAQSGKYDYVFHGHTHRPWKEKVGSTALVNPGSLGGLPHEATFATYDTKEDVLELKKLGALD